jgi:hypothetical protein
MQVDPNAAGGGSSPAPGASSPATSGAAAPAAQSPPEAGATPPSPGVPADPKSIDPAKPTEPPKEGLGKAPDKPAEAPAPFDGAKLTLPEGMKADDPNVKAFTDLMSDDKVSPQERGQKLMDLYKTGVEQVRQANVEAWNTMNTNWIKEVKADPDIGGAKFEPTKASIAKAIDQLGPELSVAFRQGLDVTGAGNHPAIWKGLAKMASILTEGGHVSGNPPSAASPDLASTFFPNSKMT